ncbi:MAG: phosphate ABC transporter permease [Gammaproteobacteria bacterium]|nr:ABC transporter permease [Gammaproteobacteria bacterium]PCH63125.1 MAG: phosphate ABC transporter permease [Gammaproteobacteria bacterium]
MALQKSTEKTVVITSLTRWSKKDLMELVEYRDLFLFLVLRDIKVLYAQTVMGFGWAIMQPLLQIIIFTLIFGKVAGVPTDGIPYFLFTTVAIVPWTYMSTVMTSSGQSLVKDQGMLGKIYFPRIIYPLTPALSALVDFSIATVIIVLAMIYYSVVPTTSMLYLPIFLLFMFIVPLGIGFWLSALAIRFRDVKFAMPFAIRMLMFSAPIVYSASTIPEKYRLLYSLNPIVGVIEGMRASLLGTAIPWEFIVPGMIVSAVIFLSGAWYFRHMEKIFVDVI